MKKIFKFMAIAMIAVSLPAFVACGDKDNDEDDPVNPDPQPGQQSLTITWGGSTANIGATDAYQLQQGFTVYFLNAGKSLSNDTWEFPLFRIALDLDTDPQYGCNLAAQWQYTINGEQVYGNEYFPTDVIESAYFNSNSSQNMGVTGDWWLDEYTTQQDFALSNAQFDANNLTLSTSFSVQMFNYAYVAAQLTEETTNEELTQYLQNAEKKNMTVAMTNFKFDAAQ